jgi:hypothetical protein
VQIQVFSQHNARAMLVLILKRSGRLISEKTQQPRQSQHLQMAWQEQQKNIPSEPTRSNIKSVRQNS